MGYSRDEAFSAFDIITSTIHEDDRLAVDCKKIVKDVLEDYFNMEGRLKNTRLWDVLEYEHKLEAPISILTLDNERLKRENNKLLKKLKQEEKYRLSTEEVPEQEFHVGDFVRSKILRANGVVYFVGADGVIGAIFSMKSSPKTFSCKADDLILIKRGEELA